MLSTIIAFVVVVISIIWLYSRWKYNYWASRGVDGPIPTWPMMGNIIYFFMGDIIGFIDQTYYKYKKNKIFALYDGMEPALAITDPELVNRILIKDFDHFVDRRTFKAGGDQKWVNYMLPNETGKDWKKLRSTMSPTFSSGKLKFMFNVVRNQAKKLVDYCNRINETNKTIDMKETYSRLSMDVIASAAFGIECNSLGQDKAIFAQKADQIFTFNLGNTLIALAFAFIPERLRVALCIPVLNTSSTNFLAKASLQAIEERKKSKIKRGDFLDLMLDEQLKQQLTFDEETQYKITDDTILAESVIFLIAGFDTTSNTLSFVTHYLAKNQDIQEKLRQELLEISQDGEFDYHSLMEAKYLDACLSEALRLVPPLPLLERVCTKDYVIPGTDVKINKGMYVEVTSWGIHRDPDYWENPLDYNPDRFMPENKDKLVPYTYMPFGIGPRNCIAKRFALMEAKIALAEVITKFNFVLAPGEEELDIVNGGEILRPGKRGMQMYVESLTSE